MMTFTKLLESFFFLIGLANSGVSTNFVLSVPIIFDINLNVLRFNSI